MKKPAKKAACKPQRKLSKHLTAGGLLCALSASPVLADQFHYNNVLIGPRAVGLGGAFSGIADDASGIYYNPAGLAFALSNDIQGSANAFYGKEIEYKNTLGGTSFVEESSGSLSPFFGGLQKLDRYVDGLVFAFGVYNVDGDLKDQDTLIEGKSVGTTMIERYHRTSNARASTFYAGAALGYRPTPAIAIGFGLNYFNADELVQEYQDAQQTVPVTVNGSAATGYQNLTSNVRERLVVHGMQPTLGVQTTLPGNLTLGLTIKKGIVASQKFNSTAETRTLVMTENQYQTYKAGDATAGLGQESIVDDSSNKPVGEWPAEARFGMAWFASPTFLLAFDVSHHTAVSNAEKLKTYNNKVKYNKEAVTNFHLGMEWYMTSSLPLRIGLFTNNDARPEVAKGTSNAATGETCTAQSTYSDAQKAASQAFAAKYCGQADTIDYVGESIFIGWVQPNSQIAAGVTFQQGSGKAQKLGDHQVQDVKASAYAFSFSATHNL